jgi:hypothetical protein
MRNPIPTTSAQRNAPPGLRPARDISTNPTPALTASQAAFAAAFPGASSAVVATLSNATIAALMAITDPTKFAAISQVVVAMAANNIWPSNDSQAAELIGMIDSIGPSSASAITSATSQATALTAATAYFCGAGSSAADWCSANGSPVPTPPPPPAPTDTSCPMPSAQQQQMLYKAALDWNAAHPSCPVPVDSMCAVPPANMSQSDAIAWNAAHPQCPVPVPMNGFVVALVVAGLAVGAWLVFRPSSSRTVRTNPRRHRRRHHRRYAIGA